MNKKTVRDIDLKGKRVLMRVDFNVPMEAGKVTDDKRIRAALPTIQYVLDQGASLVLMSHLGRPKGGPDPEFSLKPVAEALGSLLGKPVKMAPDCIGPEVEGMARGLQPGEVLMLENVRRAVIPLRLRTVAGAVDPCPDHQRRRRGLRHSRGVSGDAEERQADG